MSWRRVARLGLSGLALIAGVACRMADPDHGQTVVVALTNSPTNLDPAIGLDEASQKVHQLLYSSLLRVDEHLRVVPDLAVRFDQPDPVTYVAEIPAGVRFHDGREMTADDVVYTFRRFLDPALVSGRKGAYRSLARVEPIAPRTVQFTLTQPSAAFPINLVMGIVPAPFGSSPNTGPIGSGPYRLVEFAPDDHLTLAAFPDYYRGPPKNAGLILRVIPDETMRGLELRKGTVDLVVNDLSPDMVATLRQEGLSVTTAPGTDYAYLGFNLRDPLLQDRRVRLAIGHAIDVDAIVQYLRRGLAERAVGIVPPMSWAHEPDVFRFTLDLPRARALLDEAGFPDPDGPGPRPRLRLSLKTSTAEAYRVQAAVIQKNLAEIGVALDLRSYEFATLQADVVRGNVQLYTLQWVGVTDPDMLRRAFHSSQIPPSGFNRGHYRNADVDALLERASASLDADERGTLYRRAQQAIAADAPYISLWYKTNVAVAQPRLTGIRLSPTAEFTFLKDVTIVARPPTGG